MTRAGFPHSETLGSQVAQHLTETSFFVVYSQGIHHTLLQRI